MSETGDLPVARLEIEGDDLLVIGGPILSDRRSRLFFRTVLGAIELENGWRCPRRRLTMSTLVMRVYDWLETRGYSVEGQGRVDETVARELERRRSFVRTKEAAT